MKVGLVTIAYNLPDDIASLLASATSRRHRVEIHLFRHAEGPAIVAACERLAAAAAVNYYPYGLNRGLSRSWNEGALNAYAGGADMVLIVNDDIVFGAGDLDCLVETAAAYPEHYIVTSAGYHQGYRRHLPSHGYSCFALNPIALERLGCFDENFFPAYCEDQDFAYRARLAGLAEANCPTTTICHGGSQSLASDPALRRQNDLTQRANQDYYARKWGGESGRERFRRPFNQPQFDQTIAPERRHAPYGPTFDRTDHAIVRR